MSKNGDTCGVITISLHLTVNGPSNRIKQNDKRYRNNKEMDPPPVDREMRAGNRLGRGGQNISVNYGRFTFHRKINSANKSWKRISIRQRDQGTLTGERMSRNGKRVTLSLFPSTKQRRWFFYEKTLATNANTEVDRIKDNIFTGTVGKVRHPLCPRYLRWDLIPWLDTVVRAGTVGMTY